MRLSVKGIALTTAALWGGCLLFVGVANLAVPSYGAAFLQGISSIYPGFHVSHTPSAVVVGTAYAVADGAVGGALFAWLYNAFTHS